MKQKQELVDCPECNGSGWSHLRPFKYENDCWTCKAKGKVIEGTQIVRQDILGRGKMVVDNKIILKNLCD